MSSYKVSHYSWRDACTDLQCVVVEPYYITYVVSVATQTELAIEESVCCNDLVTERFESCMCGKSYLHVADLQFDDSGAF